MPHTSCPHYLGKVSVHDNILNIQAKGEDGKVTLMLFQRRMSQKKKPAKSTDVNTHKVRQATAEERSSPRGTWERNDSVSHRVRVWGGGGECSPPHPATTWPVVSSFNNQFPPWQVRCMLFYSFGKYLLEQSCIRSLHSDKIKWEAFAAKRYTVQI